MAFKKKNAAEGEEKVETPEVTPEEEAVQEAPAEETAEAAEENDQLKAAQAQAEEYLNMAQRVQADFENFRRRNNAVRAEAYDEGARAFAATLLPVIDNLERALQAAGEDSPLKEGVAMVLKQMLEAFEKRGITPIDRLGEVFDPNLENAVMQGSEDEGEPGTVCVVFQKGYQMDKHVLRYAMVKVVPQ